MPIPQELIEYFLFGNLLDAFAYLTNNSDPRLLQEVGNLNPAI
ncbi:MULTISPECIES: hypothetical protein [unclassified Nostoc]|nr:hypothetical protein [Nostoc sp. 'Peltigera membranacea cyanobiont' 232]